MAYFSKFYGLVCLIPYCSGGIIIGGIFWGVLQGGSKITQLVFVRTSSNLHQVW